MEQNNNKIGKIIKIVGIAVLAFLILGVIGNTLNGNKDNNYNNSSSTMSSSTASSKIVSTSALSNETSSQEVESVPEVNVIDFSSMTPDEITKWGEDNGVNCIISEDYSDTVKKGKFIGQSVDKDDAVYEGDSIYVYFSLGKEPSKEFLNALKSAENYSELMHMSKQGIYDQLTSEYGEKFPADAAQYAIDNLDANYKENALEKAKEYQDLMSMSKSAIYDQLISEYGEKFTAEEAQYAIDHLDD